MTENILISIIDGQGGGIGKQLIEKLAPRLAEAENVTIRALGTNALATNAMLKAGADDGATGENAIVLNAGKSHIIAGFHFRGGHAPHGGGSGKKRRAESVDPHAPMQYYGGCPRSGALRTMHRPGGGNDRRIY